jgi:hypothetical protein
MLTVSLTGAGQRISRVNFGGRRVAAGRDEMVRRSILAALLSTRRQALGIWDWSTEMDPSEIADYVSDPLITVGTGGVIQFSVA